ncbi:MAG: hypothetical protein JSU96_04425 [Acidobacteriota bacterium]|nr:MAG: hypothetical protein JSU96_04425 [Acidobacteriota bacterium]
MQYDYRISRRIRILLTVAVLTGSALLGGPASRLEVLRSDGLIRVQIAGEGSAALTSPPEGLWSIATEWEQGWPSDWHHAAPEQVIRAGEWTILTGRIILDSGEWLLRDSCRQKGALVECIRRFEWKGSKRLEAATLSVRFQTPGIGPRIVLPGILYHGNPSGRKSGRTPVYSGSPGDLAAFEEHRFPMPFASFETAIGNEWAGVALHSLPSPVPYGNREDQWWSMGVRSREDVTELMLLSGACAANGQRSVVKATQRGFLPYDEAYLNVEPGAVIEKRFYLQAYPVDREGQGFQAAVDQSIKLFGPFSSEGLPKFPEIISAKFRYASTRWYEQGTVAGFRKYYDRPKLVLGWCGQAAALGYALQLLSDPDQDPVSRSMVQKSLDFLSEAEFYEEGFHTWYDLEDGVWQQPSENPETLSQGQAMQNVANAIRVGRTHGFQTAKWEDFLMRASEFHAARILRSDWQPLSTNEAFFIAPLSQAWELLGVQRFREAALKAGEVYASRHLSMREPYWGGTLDASCEDKEGAWAALEGFLALYGLTGERKYLDWAGHAADVALTYLVVWDIDLPPGRLRNHDFKTRGWTAVSVQNQHIDVYGVLIAPSLYRLGELSGRSELKEVALMMFRSCGQLLDPFGSQGEQPQQTNYAQRGDYTGVEGLRGGYVEDWTVFWITAHFLNAAAQFKEQGVSVGQGYRMELLD